MTRLSVLLAALFAAGAAQAQSMDAHVHGHASLNLAIDGGVVTLELEAPAETLVGFETEPATDEERAAMADAEGTLNRPETLFAFPEAAGCEARETEVEFEREGEHAEFEATYTFQCADPTAIDAVETTLLERFERMEELEVAFATPDGQGSVELGRGDGRIALR